ncbi:MAG: conjugal transfer protein TraN, partial [Halomonadaceae bacterium]|nr:conjugal transfer protein TraN [Halomonadaceae bacterium]
MQLPRRLIKRLISRKATKNALVAFLCLLTTVQPLFPTITLAMANDLSFSAGAQEGRNLWSDIKGSTTFPSSDGGTSFVMPDGERIPVNELFQADAQDRSYEDMYSLPNATFEQKGIEGRDKLVSNPSTPEGNAYRVLRESAYQSKPDLSNDPIWGSTDAVYDFLEGKEVSCTPPDSHTPDYKTCRRVNMNLDACKVSHDYQVGVFEHVSGPVNLQSCGEGCMDFWIGKIGDNYWDGNCKIFEQAMSVRVLNPDAIISARLVRAKWDDYMQVWISENKVWQGPNNNFPPETSGSCELSTSWDRNPGTDLTSNFRNRDKNEVVNMKIRVSVTGSGEGYANIRVHYDPDKVVSDDEWFGESCINKANIFNAQYGDTGATCTQMPSLNGSGCLVQNGVTVCPSKMKPSPIPGISPFCKEVSVVAPNAAKAANTCSALESNPSCGFITSQCDGKTGEELIHELYTFGLGRSPDPAGVAHWLAMYNDTNGDYEYVRNAFFNAAGVNDENVINSFTCQEFVDTYDCGFDFAANDGACQVQDLFKSDFADCTENLVLKDVTQDIHFEDVHTCSEALELTECRVERTLTSEARSSSTTYNRGCFLSETVSYRLPWADTAIAGNVSVSSSGAHTSASVAQQPSVANDWTARINLNSTGKMVTKSREVERECEEGEEKPCYDTEYYEELECSPGTSLTATLSASGHSVKVSEKNFPAEEGNNPCFRDSDEWTDSSWTCEQQSSLSIGGVSTTMAALSAAVEPMYPGASATCLVGDVKYTTKEYGQGSFCYENLEGNQVCETIDPSNGVSVGSDSCGPLQARESKGECTYLGRFPVGDGEGSTGFQYVWEHRYDCGQSQPYTKTEFTPEYVCDGIVSCLGDECITPNRETSDDFEKAVGMLQALEQIGSDITCDVSTGGDMQQCQVFNGEAQTCKQVLGGWVDCCEKPGGVSLSDYITMIKTTAKVDNFLMNSSMTQPIQGSYASLRDPVVDSAQYVKQAFTEQFDNISAKLFGGGGGPGIGESVTAALDGFKQTMMKGAQDFLKDAFSEQVADMFFTTTADGVALAQGFSTALSVIGMIYTIYTIANIIVNIIW